MIIAPNYPAFTGGLFAHGIRGIGVYSAPGARLWLSGGPTSEINELALTKP
jgi:hypothetical protein